MPTQAPSSKFRVCTLSSANTSGFSSGSFSFILSVSWLKSSSRMTISPIWSHVLRWPRAFSVEKLGDAFSSTKISKRPFLGIIPAMTWRTKTPDSAPHNVRLAHAQLKQARDSLRRTLS